MDSAWTPDVIIFSGTFNIAALLELAPPRFRAAQRVAYFHESQWTYPAQSGDVRPYIVQHLDAVLLTSETWFNSCYHRDVFRKSVELLSPEIVPASTIESILRKLEVDSRVVYPPVTLDHPARLSDHSHTSRIVWNARWDYDKRPDRFCDMLKHIAATGAATDVLVLGTGGTNPNTILAEIGQTATIPGHLLRRDNYEEYLAGGGIVVSTADHEFFGIGILEAVLVGAVPVLPAHLAYPETLPSAWFYRAGDIGDLARVSMAAMKAVATPMLHRADAERFLASSIVPVWDDLLDQIARP